MDMARDALTLFRTEHVVGVRDLEQERAGRDRDRIDIRRGFLRPPRKEGADLLDAHGRKLSAFSFQLSAFAHVLLVAIPRSAATRSLPGTCNGEIPRCARNEKRARSINRRSTPQLSAESCLSDSRR